MIHKRPVGTAFANYILNLSTQLFCVDFILLNFWLMSKFRTFKMFMSFFVCVSNFEKIILRIENILGHYQMVVWGDMFYNSHFINNTHLTQACLGAND